MKNDIDKTTFNDNESNYERLITILFMSHRIQAKVYQTDTMESILDRVSYLIKSFFADESLLF